ncbi:MAG: sigma-54-dependent Fis family transcriptional regulator [Myxococcales bacterium]|nr:sigma-54-dependent Fis family transcriptional regulator [Myxococcales bacterium]MCB9531283.1 sigma-54-dependent Fis family transcriptional regulator [Myxococcales bacterium]
MRALIVDDDDDMRALLALVATGAGLEVDTFSTAEAGWDAFQTAAYDLVVLDWMLPVTDGLALCRRVRAAAAGRPLVILVVTARAGAGDLNTVLEAGADDYIAKPTAPDVLAVRMTVAMAAVGAARARAAAEAALRQSREGLARVLDHLPTGTVVFEGEEGRVAFMSRAAADLVATPTAGVAGQRWRDVLGLAGADSERLERLVAAAPDDRERLRAKIQRADGTCRDVAIDVFDDPHHAARHYLALNDETEVSDLRRALSDATTFHGLVGDSAAMRAVHDQIRDVAPLDWTVLIEGETGTGKELVARAIHRESRRAGKPFVAVNCASLSVSLLQSQLFGHRRGAFTGATADQPGFFEAAHGGTLFLDEIGDISIEVQVNLLRALEQGEITRVGESHARRVDVRVITATHRHLPTEVERGTFRADLMYRIRVARVMIPPLRERPGDIAVLAARFLAQARGATGRDVHSFSAPAMSALTAYRWPGNVRELRAAIEHSVIRARAPVVGVADLPAELQGVAGVPREASAPDDERLRIVDAVRRAGGNRTTAARLLGVSRATLYRRIAELGLELG